MWAAVKQSLRGSLQFYRHCGVLFQGTFVAIDSSVRVLGALGGASTSRVLNLLHIAADHVGERDHLQMPLFLSPIINKAFIVKHRTRADETYMFVSPPTVATKIIIPFDSVDLKAGGRSLLFGQRGFTTALRTAGNYNSDSLERDLRVLGLLDRLPSLDPFLMREQLRHNDIQVAPSYFAISEGDQERMHEFVSKEMSQLVTLAGAGGGLVSALLANSVGERLEPLRLTLNLTGSDFREGVFSWRGFLYYKWSMDNFWPDVIGVLREISAITPYGPVNLEQAAFLTSTRRNIIQMVRDSGREVNKALSIYDASFQDLVANQAPRSFRDFLLSAPHMFLQLGEKLGAISHIVSFWRYRFPPGTPSKIDAEQLSAIFQDFTNSLGERISKDPPLLKKPVVIDATAV
jgi:hypothetical protein